MNSTSEPTKDTILFVDDDPGVISGLRRTLHPMRNEWEITFAQSTDEALDSISQINFDAIITDIDMPGKDGFELLAALQRSELTHDIPVIILTGKGDGDLKRRALDQGATDLLNKPFLREDLIARIRSVLRLKKQQDTIKQQNTELASQIKTLSSLEKMKTDLFNMLIHDLKGPVSVILANLEMLAYTVTDESQEYVEAAQTGCNLLYTMTSDLLDISRLEEDRLSLAVEKLSPHAMVSDTLERLPGLAMEKQLKLITTLPEINNDVVLYGDKGIIARILQNLLMNAIQYSPEGETIEIGLTYEGTTSIMFFIKDNGPGIPEDLQKKIFDKFMQVGKKEDGRVYTTGLGLTFCKLAVEAHHGKIFVESDGKNGSCFKIQLPVEGCEFTEITFP